MFIIEQEKENQLQHKDTRHVQCQTYKDPLGPAVHSAMYQQGVETDPSVVSVSNNCSKVIPADGLGAGVEGPPPDGLGALVDGAGVDGLGAGVEGPPPDGLGAGVDGPPPDGLGAGVEGPPPDGLGAGVDGPPPDGLGAGVEGPPPDGLGAGVEGPPPDGLGAGVDGPPPDGLGAGVEGPPPDGLGAGVIGSTFGASLGGVLGPSSEPPTGVGNGVVFWRVGENVGGGVGGLGGVGGSGDFVGLAYEIIAIVLGMSQGTTIKMVVIPDDCVLNSRKSLSIYVSCTVFSFAVAGLLRYLRTGIVSSVTANAFPITLEMTAKAINNVIVLIEIGSLLYYKRPPRMCPFGTNCVLRILATMNKM
eukprot:scaffold220763_cov62-Attheya_sp.AAC.1